MAVGMYGVSTKMLCTKKLGNNVSSSPPACISTFSHDRTPHRLRNPVFWF